jgi:hypothetical protein
LLQINGVHGNTLLRPKLVNTDTLIRSLKVSSFTSTSGIYIADAGVPIINGYEPVVVQVRDVLPGRDRIITSTFVNNKSSVTVQSNYNVTSGGVGKISHLSGRSEAVVD